MHCPCGADLAAANSISANAQALSIAESLENAWTADLQDKREGREGTGLGDLLLRIWLLGSYGGTARARPQKLANLHDLDAAKQITSAAGEVMQDWPRGFHRLLDRNQLVALYKPTTNGDVLLASRGRNKPSNGTKVRAQSAEEPTNPNAITLPPPSLVGITNPATDAKSWQSRSTARSEPRRIRPIDRGELSVADSGDPGARPGEAFQTELSINPDDEARALDRLEAPVPPPVVASGRPTAPGSSGKPQKSGWKPARQPLPDLAGSRPVVR